MTSNWKEASTIILTALKKKPVKGYGNYSLLSLKRSTASSFMPSGYVFPGGTTEPADGSKKWLDIFSHFNITGKDFSDIIGTVPPIIKGKNTEISKLVSLKITAIREAFEETGILLCLTDDKKSKDSEKWVSYSAFKDLETWRLKVQKDSYEFLNMCIHYNCCPDINNLHLWSNWLTPTSKGKKRFDAAFFVACTREQPHAVADGTEIENLQWSTPEELIQLCESQDIWLPPPQVYEITRLLQFKNISELNNFAMQRSPQGCERWMPVQIKTINGMVSLLPGDEAYVAIDCCTPTKPAEVTMTNEEFRSQFQVLHRMEFLDKTKTKIIVKNYKPVSGHMLPVSEC